MVELNSNGLGGKIAILDQSALVDADFLLHTFRFDIGKILITRDGKTIANVTKKSGQTRPDQFALGKTVVFPFESNLCMVPYLPFAGLVRMATEGGVALALETESDGSMQLVLTPSAEKFNPEGEDVITLEGTNQMRIGYQLYCADLTVGEKVMGGPIRDFEEFKSKEMERIGK